MLKRFLLLSLLTAAATAHAQDRLVLLTQADQALAMKNFPAALAIYEKVLAANPKDEPALHGRALCHLGMKELEKAHEELNAVLELNPKNAAVYAARGSVLLEGKDYQGAIIDYTAAIMLDSTDAGFWYMRGQTRLMTGAVPEAVADLLTVLRISGSGQTTERVRELLTMVGFGLQSGEKKLFTDDEENIALKLPKEWFPRTVDDGKTLNMFVSMQRVEKESDQFMVGATIRRLRGMSKTFAGVQPDGEFLVGFWTALNEKAAEKYPEFKVISTREITVGDFTGIVRDIEFRPHPSVHRIRMYDVVLGHNDDIVTVTLEAPSVLWREYDTIFKVAMESLTIGK